MKPIGIRDFQKERSQIIKELIHEAGKNLLKRKTIISAKTISYEVQKLFNKKALDMKFLVTEQTIGRNKQYKSIWQVYKQQQKEDYISNKKTSIHEHEFSIRDKYDKLKQEYVEILDLYTLERQQTKELTQKIKKHEVFTNDITRYEDNISNNRSILLHNIKEMLTNGSVVIIKNNSSIIIKNLKIHDSQKIEITEEEWTAI